MSNVITYGPCDLFHVGHLRLLQGARALGGPDAAVISGRLGKFEVHVDG